MTSATTYLDECCTNILNGDRPELWPIGTGGLATVAVGPNRVLLLGGQPGVGKTTFIMQAVYDALRLTPTLRAIVCNVEMDGPTLCRRMLARQSQVPLTTLNTGELTDDQKKAIATARTAMQPVFDRLTFVNPPFHFSNLVSSAAQSQSRLIVIDYIQRMSRTENPTSADRRARIDDMMNDVRELATAGCGVVVVSAVARTKDTKGRNTYDGLNLASFRESSELEFGADDAYILTPYDVETRDCQLKHVKARHGEMRDIDLRFHGEHQEFRPGKTALTEAPQPADVGVTKHKRKRKGT